MYLPLSKLLATGRPDDHRVAVLAGRTKSFVQFRADVAKNVRRLAALNCRSGSPVCRDSYWFIVGFLALCHVGAGIKIPSNTQPSVLEALSTQCDFLLVDHPEDDGPGTVLLEEGWAGPGPVDPYDPQTISVEFSTAGSTGVPKTVERDAHLLECEVGLVTQVLSALPTEGLVSGMVPHHHVYGMLFRLLWPLSSGRPFSSTTHQVWETLLDELQPGGVLVTSPAHLSRIAGIDPISRELAPSVVLSAGASLLQEAVRDTHKLLGTYPTEIFGSTETGACALRETRTPDAPWKPLPGVTFNATLNGTLQVKSPAVGADTWVETADLIELLSDGGFHHRGRADRIVKIEGKRVSLLDVENQLMELDWIEIAAVTIVEAPRECLGAVVVVDRDGRDKLEEIGEFRFSRLLRRKLALTQEPAGLPRRWRFVEKLPVGDMGKRKDQDLANLFSESGKS